MHIISDIILDIGDANQKTTHFLNRYLSVKNVRNSELKKIVQNWRAFGFCTVHDSNRQQKNTTITTIILHTQHLPYLLLRKGHRSQQWLLVGEKKCCSFNFYAQIRFSCLFFFAHSWSLHRDPCDQWRRGLRDCLCSTVPVSHCRGDNQFYWEENLILILESRVLLMELKLFQRTNQAWRCLI